jgi:hypothetical protein
MKNRLTLPLVALAFLALGAVSRARADAPRAEPMPAPEAGPATVFTYGKENPDCVEWTNACQTCTRDDKGAPQCSTAGIACTPGALVCRMTKAK